MKPRKKRLRDQTEHVPPLETLALSMYIFSTQFIIFQKFMRHSIVCRYFKFEILLDFWINCFKTVTGMPMTMILNGKSYGVLTCDGQAAILKAPESEASLHIPDGPTGIFLNRMHTNYSKLKDDIPDDECIVTLLAEIIHHRLPDDIDETKTERFVFRIPHCVPDRKLWHLVKVRKWRKKEGKLICQELVQRDMGDKQDYFVMDERFITVHSQHLCTTCGTIREKRGCNCTIRVMLVAKLDSSKEKNLTTTKVKAFLCSRLLSLREFSKV